MKDVVIVSMARTAIGNFGGAFRNVPAVRLGSAAIRASWERIRLDPALIDQAWVGQARQAGNGPNPGKLAAVAGGLNSRCPVTTIQMACVSGMQAIILGYKSILLDEARAVMTAGMENMSCIPYFNFDQRWGKKSGDVSLVDGLSRDGFLDPLTGRSMGSIADDYTNRWGISRDEQDQFALESHKNAAKAWEEGIHALTITPVEANSGRKTVTIDHDEHYRPDTSAASLSRLPPVFTEGGTVTAGNASGVTDGAAALILMDQGIATELQLQPLARIVGYGVASVDPLDYGLSPVPATRSALKQAGLSIADIQVWEINEAFAVQVLAVTRELDIDWKGINSLGGAIALGHPIGMSGTRIVVSAVQALIAQSKKYAMATLCGNGGQGAAIALERV